MCVFKCVTCVYQVCGSVHDMVNRPLELRPQFARYGRKPEAAEAVVNADSIYLAGVSHHVSFTGPP